MSVPIRMSSQLSTRTILAAETSHFLSYCSRFRTPNKTLLLAPSGTKPGRVWCETHNGSASARFRYPKQLITWRGSDAGNLIPLGHSLSQHLANVFGENNLRSLAGLASCGGRGAL